MPQILHTLSRALLIVYPLLMLVTGPGRPAFAAERSWSKTSVSIPSQRAFRVPSPDRKKAVVIEELAIAVTEEGSWLPGLEGYSILLPAELAWSPDSKAFFVTANEAGADGAWYISVFILEYDRVNYYDVTGEAAVSFRKLFPCLAAEEPDVGAIKWLKDAKTLLVAVEAPARSSCSDKDAVRGYVIEVPSGKILKEFELKKLREEWAEFLGARFTAKGRR